MPWFVYIVECQDGKLYTGITNNLELRIRAHNNGVASRFTRSRKPVKLVHSEDSSTKSKALKREAGIKRLPRAKKLALIKAKGSKR